MTHYIGFLACIAIRASASTIQTDTVSLSTLTTSAPVISIQSPLYLGSGNSLAFSGAGGVVTSQSSFTASAYFGDGSHLTGLPTLASTQTFIGATQFTSTFSVRSNGRQITLSTSTSIANISITSSGKVTFYPELHNSSATAIPEGSTTNNNFGPCLVGSTLTITTAGGVVEATFTAEIENDATPGTQEPGVSILVDGSLPSELGLQKRIGGFTFARVTPSKVTSKFRWLFPATSPGMHSYCITINSRSSGTTALRGRTSNQFAVYELK